MATNKYKDKNRIIRAWEILLGRDKETPEEFALRRKRERALSFFVMPAVFGVLVSVIISLFINAPTQISIMVFFVAVCSEVVALICTNYAYKFIQTHEIRKKKDSKKEID